MAKEAKQPDQPAKPAEGVDHVDIEDGVSAGASAEPESAAQEPAAPEAAAAPAEEPVQPFKTSSDLARESIYAKHSEQRKAEIAESAKDPQVQILNAQAGGEPAEPEEPAEPAPALDQDAPLNRDDAAPEAAAAVEAAAADGIRISVYGQESIVAEDEVLRVGVQTLQKERAAEYRLQQAAESERKVRAYHKDLDAYRDRLVKMEKDLRAGVAPARQDPAAGKTAPPASGATVTLDEAKIAERAQAVAQAIYRGNAEETAKALQSLLTDVAQGRAATPPSVNVNEVVETAVTRLRELRETETYEERRTRVNDTFRTEFKDIHDDPELFAVAQTRFKALLSDPENDGKPLEEIARKAGQHVIDRFGLKPRADDGGQPPTPGKGATELEKRRTLKSKTVVRQPTSSQRQPAPSPAKQFPSNSDYVRQMRSARGLPAA
jgi:hypothetical protein